MASIRTGIAAAFALVVMGIALPVSAQALECKATLAQHTEALRVLEGQAAQARQMADENPLYIADVGYYDSVLADARQCVKTLSPLNTAAR